MYKTKDLNLRLIECNKLLKNRILELEEHLDKMTAIACAGLNQSLDVIKSKDDVAIEELDELFKDIEDLYKIN